MTLCDHCQKEMDPAIKAEKARAWLMGSLKAALTRYHSASGATTPAEGSPWWPFAVKAFVESTLTVQDTLDLYRQVTGHEYQ